ncbi:hypothetical protein H8959_010377 [Pygathrix nigripes]
MALAPFWPLTGHFLSTDRNRGSYSQPASPVFVLPQSLTVPRALVCLSQLIKVTLQGRGPDVSGVLGGTEGTQLCYGVSLTWMS